MICSCVAGGDCGKSYNDEWMSLWVDGGGGGGGC